MQLRESLLAVESRPGVKELLVITPGSNRDVRNVVLMLGGGGGGFAIGSASATGAFDVRGGYPISARQQLADAVGAVIVVSEPSDQPVMDWDWRASDQHVADLRAAVRIANTQWPNAKVWVLGVSNGALSAAVAAERIDALSGAILMSGAPEAYDHRLLDATRMRMLAVHHRRDSCLPYDAVARRTGRMQFVTVEDDRQRRPSSVRRECEVGSAHQYGGLEAQVMQMIAHWILTGDAPETLH